MQNVRLKMKMLESHCCNELRTSSQDQIDKIGLLLHRLAVVLLQQSFIFRFDYCIVYKLQEIRHHPNNWCISCTWDLNRFNHLKQPFVIQKRHINSHQFVIWQTLNKNMTALEIRRNIGVKLLVFIELISLYFVDFEESIVSNLLHIVFRKSHLAQSLRKWISLL